MIDTRERDVPEPVRDNKEYLAKHLLNGHVTLVIGAGASMTENFPSHKELVNRCIRKSEFQEINEVEEDSPQGEVLMTKMERIETRIEEPELDESEKYFNLIHQSLYEDVNYDVEMVSNPLLNALGALIMGGTRGSVKEVINFNYDDLLEWYLKINGYYAQVVKSFPYEDYSSDVTIYHPNGYLPYENWREKHSDSLILSKKSFEDRGGKKNEFWTDFLTRLFLKKVVIFVGLSGSDRQLGPILTQVEKELGDTRDTGFWIFGSEENEAKLEELKERNIIPVCLDGYDKIPKYLFDICQKASNNLKNK